MSTDRRKFLSNNGDHIALQIDELSATRLLNRSYLRTYVIPIIVTETRVTSEITFVCSIVDILNDAIFSDARS